MTASFPRPVLMAVLAVAVAIVIAATVITIAVERSAAPSVDDVSADNPCLLASSAEMQAAIGSPVGGPVTDNVQAALVGERVCQFQTLDPQKPLTLIKVGLVNAYADSVFDKYKAEHKVAPVRDLGAGAVWDAASNRLLAKKGDKVLTVLVFGPGTADPRAAATKLAERALERL